MSGVKVDAATGTGSLSFNVLQIVVLAIVVGVAVLKVGEKAEPFLAFMRSALDVVQKILWWIIRLAPIGTAGLIGNAVASYGWDLLAPLAKFTVAVYIGCAIVLFGVYSLLAAAHGLNPLKFFSGAWPAIQLAFVSRSSVGTLPVTQRVTETNLGVPREYAAFAVPIGATTKMDGCAAIYPALAANGRCRAAARDRPDPRHDAHGDERRRPGARADARGQAGRHPRRRALQRATRRRPTADGGPDCRRTRARVALRHARVLHQRHSCRSGA